jgi:transcription termination factor Rho
MRRGDDVVGQIRPARDGEKYPALTRIETLNGEEPQKGRRRTNWDDLTPLFPQDRLRLEWMPNDIAPRVIDLVAPIGKGQRGLIVSPPKAGKTTILKQIAQSIVANYPEAKLFVLLADERPEEVTDWQRSVEEATVVASTFDQPADNHIAVAELLLERVKRLVEEGDDVVVILDSITRLARAYNLAAPASGRILSGGVDSAALYPPKKFFGAARNIEFGGSLTILASALVETGSRMDEVIYEEFKGTGNMELHLERKLANRRIYPAINIEDSSTRKEELLMEAAEAQRVWQVRSILNALDSSQKIELLIQKLKETHTNAEFLRELQRVRG